ncbi:hypothetical protein BHE74_00054427 [Ensete ventricosum]|nr:hypothetical protein BHE74_00054427 [Ensete ventricosum]
MGCAQSSSKASPPRDCVRVIHMTGYVEDLKAPVTVPQITRRPAPPTYVLYSSDYLTTIGSNPLRPDDQLQPGRVYFLLSQDALRSETSAVDLANLMNRLAATAKKRGSAPPVVSLPSRSRPPAWKPNLDSIEEQPNDSDI